jgi:hypothetical protein
VGFGRATRPGAARPTFFGLLTPKESRLWLIYTYTVKHFFIQHSGTFIEQMLLSKTTQYFLHQAIYLSELSLLSPFFEQNFLFAKILYK